MTALIIAACTAVLLVLIGMIRLSCEAVYDDQGFRVSAYIGPAVIRIPRKNSKGSVSSGNKPEKITGLPDHIKLLPLLRAGYGTLCRLLHFVKTDRLCIYFTAADPDPAAAAALYSGAALALDALGNIGDRSTRKQELLARVDFDREKPELSGSIDLSIRVYRVFGLALYFLYHYLRSCKKLKKENNDNVRSSDQ